MAYALGGAIGSTPIASQPLAASNASLILTAAAGAFVSAGQAATFTFRRNLAADAGAFVSAGQAATFTFRRNLAADAGAFALTGQDAGLRKNWRLVPDAGAFALAGQDANLRSSRRLVIASAAFNLVGYPVIGGRRLFAHAGTFTFIGKSARLDRGGVAIARFEWRAPVVDVGWRVPFVQPDIYAAAQAEIAIRTSGKAVIQVH